MKIPKAVKKTFTTVGVMLVLFLAAGVGYVYYTGRNANNDTPVIAASKEKEIAPPPAPAENAGVGVAVASLLSPIAPGENTSISISTTAGATCVISASYNGKESKDSGLSPKIANAYGSINWTWTVDPTAPVGKWPVKVTCSFHAHTGFVQADLVVAK